MTYQDSPAVLTHYRHEAREQGLRPTSTMHDEITREKEVDAVTRCLDYILANHLESGRLLEVGCGNGYLLSLLAARYPVVSLTGVDYSTDMLEVAREREIPQCDLRHGDVAALDIPDATFDIVVSERCVINLLDRDRQLTALDEIARILRPGGWFICVEAFTDGLRLLNKARTELGLDENQVPVHNLWFEKDHFLRRIGQRFHVMDEEQLRRKDLPPPNFLSSHYFTSRVMYPALTRREVLYNTEFVRFWSCLPPQGNYSPIQLFLCQRIGV